MPAEMIVESVSSALGARPATEATSSYALGTIDTGASITAVVQAPTPPGSGWSRRSSVPDVTASMPTLPMMG